MTELAARLARPVHRLGLVSTVGISLALAVGLLGSAVLARAITLRDSILPGVQVARVDVGGLQRTDAEARIAADLGRRLSRPLDVAVGAQTISVRPADLFELDAGATEAAAFASARESIATRLGAIAVPFVVKQEVEPVLRVRPDGLAALSERISSITRRPRSARVAMNGLEPIIIAGRDGTRSRAGCSSV